MLVQSSISTANPSRELYCCWLLSCLFNALNYHLSLVLASVVQGDADACNSCPEEILKLLNLLDDKKFAMTFLSG